MALYESGEMYLETILVLYKRGLERVRAIDIVKEMNFSKPSVSIALSNLKKEGYVSVDANGTVELTDAKTRYPKPDAHGSRRIGENRFRRRLQGRACNFGRNL